MNAPNEITELLDSDFEPIDENMPARSSPTALVVDAWGLARGEHLAQLWAESDTAHVAPDAAADAHAALFEPAPALAEDPADTHRAAWYRQMMETPEYHALHDATALDGFACELAACAIAGQYGDYRAKNPPPGPDAPAPGSDGESIRETIERIRSTGKALEAAREELTTIGNIAGGLGAGEPGTPLDVRRVREAYKAIRDNAALRRMFDFAGRSRNKARSLQSVKVSAPRGELTGLELSGDIARLVPTELAAVAGAVPELETLSLYRLAQRRMLSYKHRKADTKAQGPVVIVVDESGSMDGAPIEAAKGTALTMAWIARHQKRWCALVGFAGATKGHYLVIPPGTNRDAQLISWLTHFYGGGTKLDIPLAELPGRYWNDFIAEGMPRGKTDVILITDAIVSAPASMLASYNDWQRREQVSTYGIVVGGAQPGDLGRICARNWAIPALDLDSICLDDIFSI